MALPLAPYFRTPDQCEADEEEARDLMPKLGQYAADGASRRREPRDSCPNNAFSQGFVAGQPSRGPAHGCCQIRWWLLFHWPILAAAKAWPRITSQLTHSARSVAHETCFHVKPKAASGHPMNSSSV